MLRKKSKAVSEGNGPVHQEEEFRFGQPAPVGFREIKSLLKQQRKQVDKFHDDMTRLFEQLSARLEQDAWQRRRVMEADNTASTKTRAPLQQYKRCVGIAFLLAGLNPAQTPTRPVSA